MSTVVPAPKSDVAMLFCCSELKSSLEIEQLIIKAKETHIKMVFRKKIGVKMTLFTPNWGLKYINFDPKIIQEGNMRIFSYLTNWFPFMVVTCRGTASKSCLSP